MRTLFVLIGLISTLFSQELSTAKIAKLVKKGEQVADIFCSKKEIFALKSEILENSLESEASAPNKANLKPSFPSFARTLIEKLQKEQSCGGLSKRNYHALGYFLILDKKLSKRSQISVPTDAKCPVCGMFVHKYPKWSTEISLNGNRFYFDGVKDMMKYYIFLEDFPYDRNSVESITVSDYYTLEAIDAKDAFYVIGSDILGPMGKELISFKNQKHAKSFRDDHGGEKILLFKDIDTKVIIQLDGVGL